MASRTKKTWNRRENQRAKAGRKRKTVQARKSTPSEIELFAACGEPGKPLPLTR